MSCCAPAALPAQHHLYTFPEHTAQRTWGTCVVLAGDIDRDGHADIAAGVRSDPHASTLAIEVLSGRDGRVLRRFAEPSPALLNAQLAPAGDVDLDGTPDLVIGAPQADGRSPMAGRVSVRSGYDGRELHRFEGELARSNFGASVAGDADVDGDGVPDIAVGVPNDANATMLANGSVRVYSGRTGTLLYRIDGTFANESFGRSVDLLADVDADGRADLLVVGYLTVHVHAGKDGRRLYSVPVATAPARAVGDIDADGATDFVVHVFTQGLELRSGKDGHPLRRLVATSATIGDTAAAAGDLDRDGIPDVVVGLPERRAAPIGPPIGPGRVRVFSGRDGRVLLELAGDHDDDLFGLSVAGGSDANRDGTPDIVAGASPHYVSARRGYVRALSSDALALTGDVHSVSITGRGAQRLQVSAPGHAGKVYAILGSISGTSPGLRLASITLPLNVDAYFALALAFPNTLLLEDGVGRLDAQGAATATFVARAGLSPSLAGLRIDHAFAVVGETTFDFASNAVPVLLDR